MAKTLHITNGDNLTRNVLELNLEGEIIVWREMLCEGPTTVNLASAEFVETRSKFLKETYNISNEDYQEKFVSELEKLQNCDDFDEVVLWFEFDLFCHLNMVAAINYLMDHKKKVPVYLVCSKKLPGDNELKGLSQLNLKQLKNHFNHKITLNQDDLEIAYLIWQLYNESNPQKLKSTIKRDSNFEYLSSCIRAHIERFPNSQNGLNTLEKNILKLIKNHKIISVNHLLGYALEYQGYYGYGDIQMKRVIDKLKPFYENNDANVVLTEKGIKALNGDYNFYQELKNDEYLGGAKVYDFLYDSDSHKILKL